MKVRSGHIHFERKVEFKQLARVFESLFVKFLEESGQLPEDSEVVNVLLEENLRELRRNRKPEGFNRDGSMRLMFPLTTNGIEMYVYSRSRSIEVARVTEVLSRLLSKHRLKHTVDWDQMRLYRTEKAQRR